MKNRDAPDENLSISAVFNAIKMLSNYKALKLQILKNLEKK